MKKSIIFLLTITCSLQCTQVLDLCVNYVRYLQDFKEDIINFNNRINAACISLRNLHHCNSITQHEKKQKAYNIISLKKNRLSILEQFLKNIRVNVSSISLCINSGLHPCEKTTLQRYIQSIDKNVTHVTSEHLKSIKNIKQFESEYNKIYFSHVHLKKLIEELQSFL